MGGVTIRVLHIGKYYPPMPGGVELFLADLLTALEARGVATAALVHEPRRMGAAARRPATERPLIYRAPSLGQLLYAPLSPSFPFWLHRAIQRFQPDVLHLHLPNTSAFFALMVPSARRLPWVVHWHADVGGSRIDRRLALAYTLYRPFEQAILANSEAVIATSRPYLDASPALRAWQDRCSVIPLGIDESRLRTVTDPARSAAEALWGQPDLRVLAVGRLTYYKGHDVLLDALARLKGVRVVIAGDGDGRERLEARIEQLALSRHARLAGLVSDDLLGALMASCDVLCLPSLDRSEAFGLVLLEAMSFGKPVVVSDIPGSGTGWVVRQAKNGLLSTPGDAASIADALSQLQQSAGLRQTLGEAGRDALNREFGMGSVAAQVEALYARAARHSRRGPPGDAQ